MTELSSRDMVANMHSFIGGVSKAGTTVLYEYLQQHPQVYLPSKKELHFFSREDIAAHVAGPGDRYVLKEIPETLQAYQSFYDKKARRTLSLDISPSYFFYCDAADRIKQVFPTAKIAFLLRNPADKAFSQYMHLYTDCRETLPFEMALGQEDFRASAGYSDIWLYRASGFYAAHMKRWMQVFGAENVKFFIFEEFLRDPAAILVELCAFFGIDSDFHFKAPGPVNVTGVPRSRLIASVFLKPNFATWLIRRIVPQSIGKPVRAFLRELNSGEKAKFAPVLRARLLSEYRQDIIEVERILGYSTGWLT